MKKAVFAIVLALMLMCSTAFAANGQNMTVVITAECYDYNHVGNEWYEYYAMNGYQMYSGDTVYLSYGDTIDLYSEISEKDVLFDDVGYCEQAYVLNDWNWITDGFTIDQYLTVQEDSGIYEGYWCEWYIHYEFVPVY